MKRSAEVIATEREWRWSLRLTPLEVDALHFLFLEGFSVERQRRLKGLPIMREHEHAASERVHDKLRILQRRISRPEDYCEPAALPARKVMDGP